MARRRYQRGSLKRVGDRWIGRWREDVIQNGTLRRVNRKEVIGTADEYPTKRLAQRALDLRLSTINSSTYRARPTATFADFAERWQATVLSQHKPSTQRAARSVLKRHLIPAFGKLSMWDVTTEVVQEFVAGARLSPKSVRNAVMLLRSMWNSAKAWSYVAHDPFAGLVLPKLDRPDPRYFTLDEMQQIIAEAKEPYKTLYWLAAETGMRAGELAGLRWEDADLVNGILSVRRSVWQGGTQTPKTPRSIRHFAISPALVNALRERSRSEGFVFLSKSGTPLDMNMVVKRKLKPLCVRLGIEPAGFHAFRHGNATVMDQRAVPAAVRQSRLGHSDMRVTLGYTHALTEDDRRFAQAMGVALTQEKAAQDQHSVA